jgi:hypothetical protein
MLAALGGDPTRCGYTPTQISDCLARVVSDGVHQEGTGEAHLLSMLWERGLVPPSAEDWKKIRPHPEVMKLRFVDDRSPIEDVPEDLRRELYRILLDHCFRAVQRRGTKWLPYDPLKHSPRASRKSKNRKAPRTTAPEKNPLARKEALCTSSAS